MPRRPRSVRGPTGPDRRVQSGPYDGAELNLDRCRGGSPEPGVPGTPSTGVRSAVTASTCGKTVALLWHTVTGRRGDGGRYRRPRVDSNHRLAPFPRTV